jgi:hypothetical protein
VDEVDEVFRKLPTLSTSELIVGPSEIFAGFAFWITTVNIHSHSMSLLFSSLALGLPALRGAGA